MCGNQLEDAKTGNLSWADQGPETLEKPNAMKFIIIGAVILVLALVLGFVIYRHSQKVEDKASMESIGAEISQKKDELTESAKEGISNLTPGTGTAIPDEEETDEEDSDEEADEEEEEAEEDEFPDYIIPYSDSTFLTNADIQGLTLQEINYAKNEIYARHGRGFKSQELRDYFASKSWYVEKYSPDDFDAHYSANMLNKYEKTNAEFLSKIEFSMNPKGYELDKK